MGIAIVTLIDSTVRVTIRHSDSPPIASVPATAWVSLDKATGTERPSKPTAPDDRVMAEFPELLGQTNRPTDGNVAATAGNIAAVPASNMAKKRRRGWLCPVFLQFQASAVMRAPASEAPGCQSIGTKPRVCSTRRNQVRIAGKVARSKSQRSATWV